MKLALSLLLLPLLNAQVPSSLTVAAGDGTSCVLSKSSSVAIQVRLVCKQAGVVTLQSGIIAPGIAPAPITVLSVGDVTWYLNWADVSTGIVHYQASIINRAGIQALVMGQQIAGEFTAGETVQTQSGATGVVSHWIHNKGISQFDATSTPLYSARLVIVGYTTPFNVGDTVTGQTSGTSYTVASVDPSPQSSTASMGDLTWPTSLAARVVRAMVTPHPQPEAATK